MIDNYCIYRISYPKKVLDMDVMYPTVVKKSETKMKTMSCDILVFLCHFNIKNTLQLTYYK